MKKNEFKQILKPLIKECIKEVIFEDGTLSGIISEVVQGLKSNAPASVEKKIVKSSPSEAAIQARHSFEETKKNLQESTGLHGAFEGTTPLRSQGSSASHHGPLRDHNPSDAGVDISGIMKVAGGVWNQLK
tara:strand:+ start:15114 stop:15506 length:393 start_codon:yes stop_codon:yes gene_type:complete